MKFIICGIKIPTFAETMDDSNMVFPERNSLWADKALQILPYFLFALPVILTARLPFFWDTLQLASRHAHFFYETGFSSLFLPNDMDSGHIPVFGMFLALMWMIFGKTLLVSHLSMLPFVLGTVFFTGKLVRLVVSNRHAWFWTTLLLSDAAMVTQFTLVSPDVWLLFFLSMALYAFFSRKRVWLTIAVTGLTLTSMRGMMLTAALFTAGWISVLMLRRTGGFFAASWSYIRKSFPVYVVPFLIAGAYLGMHYLQKGWIGYHDDMPWAEHFRRTDLAGLFRNGLVLAWRLTDNGRIFTWIIGLFLIIRIIRSNREIGITGKKIVVVSFVVLMILSFSMLTYRNLSGHRYLIPVFYLLILTVVWGLNQSPGIRYKKLIAGLLLAGLISGHFWVYPDRISKGWDAMLAYLPYQSLRKEMIRYIDHERIEFREVGTDFPNNIPLKYIDLTDDNRSFGSIEDGTDNFRYIFYSNVFNGFSDDELNDLFSKWKVVKKLNRGQVKVILFENPLSPTP